MKKIYLSRKEETDCGEYGISQRHADIEFNEMGCLK